MPLFGGKNKLKADPPRIRIEKVVVESRPKPKPSPNHLTTTLNSSPRPSPRPSHSVRKTSASPYPSSSDDVRRERKRKASTHAPPRKSPVSDRITFDKDSDREDEDDDWVGALESRKRQRRSEGEEGQRDKNRALRHPKAFLVPVIELRFVHAADVASLKDNKCEPVLGAAPDQVAVKLQYPSLYKRER
jgi:[histone H3]-lysine79 N-trimethyltransferase